MKLASLLNQELICLKSPVTTKAEAIAMLIGKMYKNYTFELDKDSLEQEVKKRETLGGTTFASGIAVPHARLDKFKDLIIGICVPQVPFQDEGTTVRMVVMILTDKSSSALYLNSLAAFLTISKKSDSFDRLLQSATAGDFIEKMTGLDISIKKELTVADIMTTELVTVRPETNLKDLADMFYSNKLSYIPVLDAKGDFIGEVTVGDTLRLGIPDYATMVGSLNFLSTFEPLEELLKNEEKLLVAQIMKKPSFKFTESTSIIEAVLELTQNKRRHIPVVRDKKIVGVVSTMDILNKVLRG